MRAFLLILILVLVLAGIGWIGFYYSERDAGVNVDTDKIQKDTERVIDKTKDLLDGDRDQLEEDSDNTPAVEPAPGT